MKIGRHKWGKWHKYIIPKRLTLKSNPPIYKWLWWYISFKCQHKVTIAINEEGHAGIYCVDCEEQLEKEC